MTLLSGAVFALSAILQMPGSALTGSVVDPANMPVPGATVRVVGGGVSATAVSDRMGRFRVVDLAAGSYVVTVSLAGFRTQTLSVRVDPSAPQELMVTMRIGIAIEVLWIVPEPADAYRKADAIAHLRIDGTRRYGPCGDAWVVTSQHDASVLRVFKGRLPERMQLDQEAAGRCSERGQWHEGIERPYRIGDEHVIFLTARPDGWGRLAGGGGPRRFRRREGERQSRRARCAARQTFTMMRDRHSFWSP
jgi:hypothetical protein